MENKNIRIMPPQLLNDPYPVHVLNQKDLSVQSCNIDYVEQNGLYTSLDPRTYNSRGQRLEFNEPPRSSTNTQPQGNLYTDHNKNNTGFYPNYQSIKGGDILYYTDIDTDIPFSNPPFLIPAYSVPQILIDPMGSIKPYYKRIPVLERNNNIYEYSFDQDQCEFREDLMALRLSSIQKSDYTIFQYYNDPEQYFPSYQTSPPNYPWLQNK